MSKFDISGASSNIANGAQNLSRDEIAKLQRQKREAELRMERDVMNSEEFKCADCGGRTFHEVVLLRRVSELVSSTGKEQMLPIPTVACVECNEVPAVFEPKIPTITTV